MKYTVSISDVIFALATLAMIVGFITVNPLTVALGGFSMVALTVGRTLTEVRAQRDASLWTRPSCCLTNNLVS